MTPEGRATREAMLIALRIADAWQDDFLLALDAAHTCEPGELVRGFVSLVLTLRTSLAAAQHVPVGVIDSELRRVVLADLA